MLTFYVRRDCSCRYKRVTTNAVFLDQIFKWDKPKVMDDMVKLCLFLLCRKLGLFHSGVYLEC